jgi:hypothetical protein
MVLVSRNFGTRAQALPLVVVAVALAAVAVVGLGRFAVGAVDAARARTAADAAALAGATGGFSAAARAAAANDGRLVSFGPVGDDVVAIVEVGTARATARGTVALGAPPSPKVRPRARAGPLRSLSGGA